MGAEPEYIHGVHAGREDVQPILCSHPQTVYCTGQSELKGEDVLFVEHCRRWPGSDLTEPSVLAVRSSGRAEADDDAGSSADAGSPSTLPSRWLPDDFAPCCPSCGADTSHYSLFCVFDGHNGAHAARMCGEAVLPLVEARLPLGCPPPSSHPLYARWCELLQYALVDTMAELNRMFAQHGIHAGATATIVLQHGWLLTAVNVGDSRAVLDTGADVLPLTAEHRVASNKGERRRLESSGAKVAPVSMTGVGPASSHSDGVGPLRVWPGGLCLSRAIGDFDVGDAVLPFPHLMQVQLPPTGGRVLVASDGVWDAFDKMSRAGTMTRGWVTDMAPSRLIQTIVRAHNGLRDDTTVIVADVLPPSVTFPQMAAALRKGGAGSAASGGSANGSAHGGGARGGGGLCACFGSGSPTVELPAAAAPPAADPSVASGVSSVNPSVRKGNHAPLLLADVDIAAVLGMMTEVELRVPGWYSDALGEQLQQSAVDACETWHRLREQRYSRPSMAFSPSLPQPQPRRRPRRKTVAFSAEAEAVAEGDTALAPRREGGMPALRHPSQYFAASVASEGEGFALKFGQCADGDSPAGEGGAAALRPEASVRAEAAFDAGASLRDGVASLSKGVPRHDPLIRLSGSSMDQSVHVRSRSGDSLGGAASAAAAEAKPADASGLRPVHVVKRSGKDSPAPKA